MFEDEPRLQDAARDVSYEVNRFFQAAILYPRVSEENGKRLILEALLLHFRNLLDFFFGEARHSDDVRASDFFDDPSAWSPVRPKWLDEYRRRCHKLLAHLTYSRVDYSKRGDMTWELEDKCKVIYDTWQEFRDGLPEERKRWFPYGEGTL